MFCSDQNCDVICEHQVHGAKCDEIPPRVIISCERSFIIIWQLRYYIRVAREGRWEFQNWDWFRSSVVTSPSPTKSGNKPSQKFTKRYLGFHQPFNLLKQNSLRISRGWEPISQNTLHWYHLHKTSIAWPSQAGSTTQHRSSRKLLMFRAQQ